MPALHARWIVGLSAVLDPGISRMTFGFVWMMLFRSEICAWFVFCELTIFMLILPLNGARLAVRVASFSTCGRQSLPRKLLLSTKVNGPACAAVFVALPALAAEVTTAVAAIATTSAMPSPAPLRVSQRR